MHHFPFHIGDFATATARFDLVQTGVYLRLLLEYYSGEQPLDDDLELLAFKIGAKTKPEQAALKLILKLCFTYDATRKSYIQARCEDEIASYHKNVLQSRYANVCHHWEKVNKGQPKPEYGEFAKNPSLYFDFDTKRVRKVTARNDFALQSVSESDPTLPRPDSQPITNHHSPITNHQSTPKVPSEGTATGKGPKAEAVAEAIYAIYPRKVGKAKAIPSILAALKKSKLTELEMQARVKSFADAMALWPAEHRQYIPNPATWFNQGRYDDDPQTWARSESRGLKPQVSAEKKERAAAPGPSAEPEWDWRALAVALWGEAPEVRWEHLPASTRHDLRRAWDEKNKKGGAGAA